MVSATVVGLVAAAAFAYWSSVGSGRATGTSGTTSVLTLTPGTATAALYPGGTSPVQLTINNPGAASVHVVSLALNTSEGTGGFDVDAAHPDCDEGSLGFVNQTNGGSGWTVPYNGSLTVTLASSLSMSTDAADGCQGASFTVHLSALG